MASTTKQGAAAAATADADAGADAGALLARGRAVLAAQPFSVLLGAELLALAPGRAELALAIVPALRQQYGVVHGGVLSYLADNALTFAAGSLLGDCVTVEHKLNYLRPAAGDGQLVAVAEVVGGAAGRTQAVSRCEIYVDDGRGRRLCAAGQGTVQRTGLPASIVDAAAAGR